MSSPGDPRIIRKKKRRRKHPIFPFIVLLLILACSGMLVRWVLVESPAGFSRSRRLPQAFITDRSVFEQEYKSYYGVASVHPRAEESFGAATEAANKGNLSGAISVLDSMEKTEALPVVFHDLGVAYDTSGDPARASEAFREVLTRDPAYGPTRAYLRETKRIHAGAAEPYTREQESNNDASTANLIPLKVDISGELSGTRDNTDFYRIAAPAAPRDLIKIEVENRSMRLSPRLRVYDHNQRLQSGGDAGAEAGGSISLITGPPANSTLYLSVSSSEGPGGLYVLRVTPLKAFDRFEPNDELLSARAILTGSEIEADIMDAEDTDYFSFVSPRAGLVTIELRNRSKTLIPVITAYDSDRRNAGQAQDVRKPGSDAHSALPVQKDQMYFVQVSSQAGTAGGYSLRIE